MVILLLALLFLGPEKLPDAARKIGRFMNDVRRMTSGFEEEVRSAMDLSGATDASQRSSGGPRLVAPPETTAPDVDAEATASVTETEGETETASPVTPATAGGEPSGPVTPLAPAPSSDGPELVKPGHVTPPRLDDAGAPPNAGDSPAA